jgi:hypothetical protein
MRHHSDLLQRCSVGADAKFRQELSLGQACCNSLSTPNVDGNAEDAGHHIT